MVDIKLNNCAKGVQMISYFTSNSYEILNKHL